MLAACCQITSTANMAHNLQICRNVLSTSITSLTLGNSSGSLRRREGIFRNIDELTKAIFLPEGSDFIARNSLETVQIAKEAGPINHNIFIKGLQEQAIESSVSVTAGVHLPTDSESHVPLHPPHFS